MNLMPIKPFRIRRAARVAGKPDIVHELEWLGGEALVAPLPQHARIDAAGSRIGSPLAVRVHDDQEWLAL